MGLLILADESGIVVDCVGTSVCRYCSPLWFSAGLYVHGATGRIGSGGIADRECCRKPVPTASKRSPWAGRGVPAIPRQQAPLSSNSTSGFLHASGPRALFGRCCAGKILDVRGGKTNFDPIKGYQVWWPVEDRALRLFRAFLSLVRLGHKECTCRLVLPKPLPCAGVENFGGSQEGLRLFEGGSLCPEDPVAAAGALGHWGRSPGCVRLKA